MTDLFNSHFVIMLILISTCHPNRPPTRGKGCPRHRPLRSSGAVLGGGGAVGSCTVMDSDTLSAPDPTTPPTRSLLTEY